MTTTAPPNAGGLMARLANTAAPPLIVIAPFASFVGYHDYDLTRPETLICALALIGVGLTISGIAALRAETLRPALIGLLLFLFIDIQFRSAAGGGLGRILAWEPVAQFGSTAFAAITVLASLLLMAVTWLLRRHIGEIVSACFLVIILSGVLLPTETITAGVLRDQKEDARNDLPPIIHIVLDGQIGLAGLTDDIPGAPELRKELREFYDTYDFTYFSAAYTHYASTFESLTNLVNGQVSRESGAFVSGHNQRIPSDHIELRENAWFRRIKDHGYRLRVYQTDYLNFCSSAGIDADFCFSTPGSSILSVMESGLSTADRARVIMAAYLSGSLIYRIVTRAIQQKAAQSGAQEPSLRWPWAHPRLGAMSAVSVLDRIVRDLRIAPRGTAFFAHLLIPHGAFLYDADCGLRSNLRTWLGSRSPLAQSPFINTERSRLQRYKLYFEQVRCTHRKLRAILETLQNQGAWEEATIIIHGDHGSRIGKTSPNAVDAEYLSERDLIDHFSTLFAIRSPGISPGNRHQMTSIQRLFANLLLERPLPEGPQEVFLSPPTRKIGQALVSRPMAPLGP